MAANKGDPVTLHCNYSTSATNVYIYWYKQLPNRSPTFMLSVFSFGTGTTEEFKKSFNASLNTQTKSVPLTIKNLRVSDSAVYYCALKPTPYKNSNSFFTFISIFHSKSNSTYSADMSNKCHFSSNLFGLIDSDISCELL
uniref:Ig-like domain-containing protein n=1 Tax=Cyprinus carpio TaxID=7962 RepID=A0A8C2I6Z8_CYPCA